MHLTREEERILEGEHGEAKAFALRVIVKVGEALGADRLIKIKHAHVSGASYSTVGKAGLEFLESIAGMGARVEVPTTVNPIGFDELDLEAIPYTRITREYYEAQTRIVRALERMGVEPILTCTPYYTDIARRYNLAVGDHVSWGESSAVLYANSVLGLRTNREGGPLALMSAITGLTYRAGLHVPEERTPKRVYVLTGKNSALNEAEAGVLGELVATMNPDEAPPLLHARFSNDPSLREFMAAVGTAGPLGMVYIPGVTPERPVIPGNMERIEIEYSEVRRLLKERAPTESPDIVYIGCPHAGLEDLLVLREALKKASRRPKSLITVSVSREVYEKARTRGIIGELVALGVRFVVGTCLIVSPFGSRKGEKPSVATNSYKAYYYLSRKGIKAYLAPIDELIASAAGG